MITFHEDAMSDLPLAYIAENDIILAGIAQRLAEMKSDVVRVRYNARVKGYTFPESSSTYTSQSTGDSRASPWVQVHLEDGETVSTRLLVSHRQFDMAVACVYSG